MPRRVVGEVDVYPFHGVVQLPLRTDLGTVRHEPPVVPAVEVPLVHAEVLVADSDLPLPVRALHLLEAPAPVVPGPVGLGIVHKTGLGQIQLLLKDVL